MLLLTGPPGSGKTFRVLETVRDCARRGATDTRLIVPTATMAEHLRNELARDGFLVRPETVQTLWEFIDNVAGSPPQAPDAVFQHLVRASIAELDPLAFRAAASMPGLQAAIADLITELDLAGDSPVRIADLVRRRRRRAEFAEPVLEIAARVRTAVAERGMELRGDRLRRACRLVAADGLTGVNEVLFDGFFRFTAIELELVRALAACVNVTVTLPVWDGAVRTKDALTATGFLEEVCAHRTPDHERQLFAAPSPDREAEEIARRLLGHAAQGRPFREMGVILRGRSPYVPALRRAFARFAIPARFYFAESLDAHAAVRRIAGVVNALLGGWDQEDLIAAIRLEPASASLDRLEYELLESLPGDRGARAPADTLLEQLHSFDHWQTEKVLPSVWAERVLELANLFPPPSLPDQVPHHQALLWRGYADALKLFQQSLASAVELLGEEREVSLSDFWQQMSAVLASTQLRLEDNRRNVVHVMDAYEARQWRLPVVFVCGLNERLFPVHHTENPLLGDAAREALRDDGLDLVTSRDRDAEERFLFDLATTRATEVLTLSYASFDEAGREKLPSLLLERFRGNTDLSFSQCVPVRPRPGRTRQPGPRPGVREVALLDGIAAAHSRLSPSSVERFLQCPFAFFAERTLRLREIPTPPSERLDPLLEGNIIHAVLAELVERPAAVADWAQTFERIFERRCAEAGVPPGYRKQTARLELRNSLARYVARGPQPAAESTEIEMKFEFPLTAEVTVSGRMDRVDFPSHAGPLVVDYKYSPPYKLRDYTRGNEEGQLVQAGLYLAGIRERTGKPPGGMLFCALRDGLDWKGWHTLAEWAPLAPLAPEEAIARLIDTARNTSRDAASRIRAGVTDASPADNAACAYCSNHDICRVESAPFVRIAGGSPA